MLIIYDLKCYLSIDKCKNTIKLGKRIAHDNDLIRIEVQNQKIRGDPEVL
jgi:hypothetical protein